MKQPSDLQGTASPVAPTPTPDAATTHPACALRLGDWDSLGAAAAQVRTAVFLQEQGIAPEDEWDDADAGALHAVVFSAGGQPWATGRLLAHASKVGGAGCDGGIGKTGRIGRMATVQSARGQGLGLWVLQALVQAARARGDAEVMLHAQQHAQAFYARAGFVLSGPPFDEVGIPHVEMRLRLR